MVVAVILTDGRVREIYKGKNLQIPDDFDSTLTTPPVHFMQCVLLPFLSTLQTVFFFFGIDVLIV